MHFCPKLKPQNAILNFKIIFMLFIRMNELILTRLGAEYSWNKKVNILLAVNTFVYCACKAQKEIFSGI